MNKNIVKQFFPELVKRAEKGRCPFCNKKIKISDFRDNLSVKEFKISGLCMACQDKTFGKGDKL